MIRELNTLIVMLQCDIDKVIDLVKGKNFEKDENTDERETDNKDALAEQVDQFRGESTSQRSLAILAIRNKNVIHVPETSAFVVTGSRGDKYASAALSTG